MTLKRLLEVKKKIFPQTSLIMGNILVSNGDELFVSLDRKQGLYYWYCGAKKKAKTKRKRNKKLRETEIVVPLPVYFLLLRTLCCYRIAILTDLMGKKTWWIYSMQILATRRGSRYICRLWLYIARSKLKCCKKKM